MSRLAFFLLLAPLTLSAQVSYERILNADEEPHNWLTYSGTYASIRYSLLEQITPANVSELELKWVFQAQSLEKFESSPLVVDGIMYLTEAPNTAVALDAERGRIFWTYQYNPSTESRPCCGRVNRGLAMLGNSLFMATIDAQLIAIDAINGQPLWSTEVADPAAGYAMTLAPLVVKDKVIVGVAGGEFGIRGFISAYEAETGEEAWRFHTIPGPGEPGHETWEDATGAWRHGGASVWLTGSYDPDLDRTYWGIGNPGPDWNPAQRPGDNLYSDAVVALDPDTGELDWYFQFTPNDDYDYDAVQIPVLADLNVGDFSSGKQMLWGNRNGFFYLPAWEGYGSIFRPAALLSPGLGSPTSRVRVPGGPQVPGRLPGYALSGRAERTEHPRRADQQLDGGSRYGCRDRDRPGNRRAPLEVRDDRCHHQRDSHYRDGCPVYGWSGGVLPRARCGHGRTALENRSGWRNR